MKKINPMHLSFSLIAAIMVIVAMVSGTAVSVSAGRGLYLVERTLSAEDFYGAIGVWSLTSVWLAVLSARSYMPKPISELLSFGMNSKLNLKQIVFILVCGVTSICLVWLIAFKFTNA